MLKTTDRKSTTRSCSPVPTRSQVGLPQFNHFRVPHTPTYFNHPKTRSKPKTGQVLFVFVCSSRADRRHHRHRSRQQTQQRIPPLDPPPIHTAQSTDDGSLMQTHSNTRSLNGVGLQTVQHPFFVREGLCLSAANGRQGHC